MRAGRLLSIMMILQTRQRVTAQELAEELEVSERTIYRDLESLSVAGIPLYADRGPGGGFALMEGYRSGLTMLNDDEARSLLLAANPGPMAALGMEKPLQEALLKLLASLPDHRRQEAERQRALIHLDGGSWFNAQEPVPLLPRVQRGLWENRRLRILYRTGDGSRNERLIDPYGLVAKLNVWYVVASTPAGMRVYRVSRILQAELTVHFFERPDDFDLPAFWESWRDDFERSLPRIQVRVRFSPQIMPALAQHFGVGIHQRLEAGQQEADGSVCVNLDYESVEQAAQHLTGLGAEVEVLEPPELRQKVIGIARAVLARYGSTH